MENLDDQEPSIDIDPDENLKINEAQFSDQFRQLKKNRKHSNTCRLTVILMFLAFIISLLIYTLLQNNIINGVNEVNRVNGLNGGSYLSTSNFRMKSPLTTSAFQVNKERILCRIVKNRNCNSNFIADSADLLWVISPVYSFDVEADRSYFELQSVFKSYIKSFGLNFINVEAIRSPTAHSTYEDSREAKQFILTKPNNEPEDMQVYYYNAAYIRENLLNVAIRKLDELAPWEYVVWIDNHQYFENTYWWEETIYKTEKFGAVQLFGSLTQLSTENITGYSYTSVIRASLVMTRVDKIFIVFGNAYGTTKNIYNKINFIYDECIASSCDCAYALASFPPGTGWDFWSPIYYKNFDNWINNARSVFNYSRTYVRGKLYHFSHGKTFPYMSLQIAVEKLGFNASLDIKRDSNFSIQITNERVSQELEKIIFESKRSS